MAKRKITIPRPTLKLVAIACGSCFIFFVLFGIGLMTLLTQESNVETRPVPFPVSVDPVNKQISEHPEVNQFFDRLASGEQVIIEEPSWFSKFIDTLLSFSWYQNLASPTGRILVVQPGERREEVAANFSDILGWSTEEKAEFLTLVASSSPQLSEGKFFPGRYITTKDADPKTVALMVIDRFDTEVESRYIPEVAKAVSLEEALVIASLLQREAYDFEDMRHISGIIWKRLFIDMNLQLDASLQYAKGSSPQGPWWPIVRPADKYIDSPFNTYKNKGLPPTPIANPSVEAIVAALNPIATDCLFYFHDSAGAFHCSEDYQGHVAKLREIYGRGR